MSDVKLNPILAGVETPPVALVQSWTANRTFTQDQPLLDLAQAAPGWPMAEAMTAHLTGVLNAPGISGYAPILGRADLRAAHAAETARIYGGDIRAEETAIVSGCNQAFVVTMMALVQPGDAVILPTPWYFNHKMTLDMLGVEAIPLPCRPEDGMAPDPAAAEAMLTSRVKALVLVTPNNPTGAIYSPDLIARFAEIAEKAGIALVIDETYRDFIEEGQAPHNLFANPDWAKATIQLYSFSKAYAMPGLRVGAVVAAEPVIACVQKALDSIAICAPTVGQAAALFGIERLAHWRRQKADEMRLRLAGFRDAMKPLSNEFPVVSAGGFFAYCKHPLGGDALTAAKRLSDECSIMAMPGSAFGPGQDEMIRFAFGNIAPEKAAEASMRMGALI